MNKGKKESTWIRVRGVLNDIHLWGGLISGIVVFIVCLTGTIYTYNTELRAWALSEYYTVKAEGDKIDPDKLVATISADFDGQIQGIIIPHAAQSTTMLLYAEKKKQRAVNAEPEKKAPAAGRRPRASQLAVNPYTGQVIGDPGKEKTKTAEFMQKLFGLHRWLLLNEIEEPIIEGVENRKLGSWITGTATLLFLLGVITGMVIWFPKKIRSWKNGLKIRWSANWKRVNHDIHNTLGLYSCVILFLMAVTGPFWSFDWYRTGWQKTWGTYQAADAPKKEKSPVFSTIPVDGKPAMTIQETVLAVNKILPYSGDLTINFAKDSLGTIAVSKNRTGFFAPSAGDKITLDQYTGAMLEKDIFREKPFRERASASIKALHIGNIYGDFTKLLYFISCLIATSLPVTGVLIWLNKMKKNPKKK